MAALLIFSGTQHPFQDIIQRMHTRRDILDDQPARPQSDITREIDFLLYNFVQDSEASPAVEFNVRCRLGNSDGS